MQLVASSLSSHADMAAVTHDESPGLLTILALLFLEGVLL